MAMLGLLGGIISAVGAIQAGKAQKAAGEYQAAVARNNKIIAEQEAVYERQAGHVEEQALLMKYGQALGEAHAAQGASGVETESGSSKDVMKTIELMKLLDATTIQENTERKARSFQIQGTNYEAEARLREFEGAQAEKTSFFQAAGNIIGGMQSMFSSMGGGGFSMGGGGGASVAPKWTEMAATGAGSQPNLLSTRTYGTYKLPYAGNVMSGI